MNVRNLGGVPKLVPDVRNRRLIAVAIGVVGLLAVTTLSHLGQSPPAAATTSPGVTQRVSVRDDGSIADFGGFSGTVSADGRWTAFAASGGLDPVNKGSTVTDIYVRGLTDGHTYLISGGNSALPGNGSTPVPTPLGPADVAANGNSLAPSISADGRYVAFTTGATNIVPNVVSGSTVILICDRDPKGTGHLDRPQDYRCLLAAESPQPPPPPPPPPSSSPPPPPPPSSPPPPSPRIMAAAPVATTADRPSLSADASRLTWFDSGSDGTRAAQKVTTLNKDKLSGALIPPGPTDTRIVTAPWPNGSAWSFGQYYSAKLSADGRHLVGEVTYNPSTYCIAFCGTSVTTVVDVDLNANNKVTLLAVDNTGQLIAGTPQSSAASGDAHEVAMAFTTATGYQVVYLATRKIQPDGGLSPVVSTELVSTQPSGAQTDGTQPALSRDGRYLAFVTDDPAVYDGVAAPVSFNCFNSDGPPLPTSVACQVVLRDLTLDHQRAAAGLPMVPAELASPSVPQDCAVHPPNTSCAGDNDSRGPSLSGDGGVVVFDSRATNLGPVKRSTNPYNQYPTDVFARTLMPGLRIDPIDFGDVQIGQSRTMTTTVHHTGFGPAAIVGVGLGGTNPADFVKGGDTCLKQTLNGQDTCLVTVTYTPRQAGVSSAQLVIDTQRDTQLPRQQFTGSLTASAVAVVPPPAGPEFNASLTLDFGSRLPLSTTTLPVTVTNAGGSPLHISTTTIVAATPATADYTITGNGCAGTAVQPGGSCQVSVSFTPHGLIGAAPTPDLRTASIQFDDDAPSGRQLIALSGSMVQPAIQLSPPVVPPGGVVRVTGTGFTPSVKIIVHYLDGFPESTTAQSDAGGTFTADLLIFPGNDVGQRTVQAAVDGSTPVVAAVKDLLVVPASLQPPNLFGRR